MLSEKAERERQREWQNALRTPGESAAPTDLFGAFLRSMTQVFTKGYDREPKILAIKGTYKAIPE